MKYTVLYFLHLTSLIDADNGTEDTTFQIESEVTEPLIYDEKEQKWVKDAVLSVAYYLRAHKFNNFDRRYYENLPAENVSNLYGLFPDPPLKFFHWEVFDRCKNEFLTCLRYLYETILDTYLQRSIDTIYVMRRNNLTFDNNATEIEKIEHECLRLKEMDWQKADPFKGPFERFQWATTAAYYMCWFTMKELPDLEYFDEPCDNFANCLQADNRTTNDDYRANDSAPFQCALYSFCPDFCCKTIKLLKTRNDCASSLGNPCGILNNKICSLNRTLNQSFISAIYNEWNSTCVCRAKLFKWNSRYGQCIDYNECQHENPCHPKTEECSNMEGNFTCRCKFGFRRSPNSKKCEEEDLITRALERFSGIETGDDGHCVRASGVLCLLIIVSFVTKI